MDSTIPEDVIDEILTHLHDNSSTLKHCSLVSRSFLTPSRRLLFSTVFLKESRHVDKFYLLLQRSPEISNLVSTLQIYIDRIALPTLPAVLSHVTRVRHFSIDSHDYFTWGFLESEIRESMHALLVSNTLHSLKLAHAFHLPTAFIRGASTITMLSLEYCDIDEETEPCTMPLPCLETLHLGREVKLGPRSWTLFATPTLRQLSIYSADLQALEGARHILAAAADSIQDVIWHHYVAIPRAHRHHPDLGALKGLQRLSFATLDFAYLDARSTEAMWTSLINELSDHAVVRNLERLVIAVLSSRIFIHPANAQM